MFGSKATLKSKKEFIMLFRIAGIYASNKLWQGFLEC